MSEAITREELKAIVETQSKATEQMVLVAKSLSDILFEQKKLTEKLANGALKDVIQQILEHVDSRFDLMNKSLEDHRIHVLSCQEKLIEALQDFKPKVTDDIPEIKESLVVVKDDIKLSKWFIGIVGIAIIITTTIIRGIDNKTLSPAQIKQLMSHVVQEEVKELQ